MQHPDEGMIHAWLDGELSSEDAATLQAHVADCVSCTAAVAEARGLIAGSSRIVSSLDSVPAGVIPDVRRARRAWYSTTQFRAAAALLLVAGTSLLVVNRNGNKADKIMTVAAPRVVATDAMSTEAAAPTAAAAAEAPSAKTTASTRTAGVPQGALQKQNSALPGLGGSSNAPVPAAHAPLEKKRLEPSLDRTSAIAVAGGRESSLKSAKSAASAAAIQDSGVPAATAPADLIADNTLKLIRTDSLRGSTNRVFEMTNGIQLIMTEREPLAFSPGVAQSTSTKELSVAPKAAARAALALPAPLAKDQVKFSDNRTITWVDAATGRSYSLTGPLPPDQLEKFKALVVKLSR